MEIGNPSFAFVKNSGIQDGRPFYVAHYLRQAFGLFEEFVSLESRDGGERVPRARLGQGDNIVGHRIDAEIVLIKILHDKCVAEFGYVYDAVDVVGKFGVILQGESITSRRDETALNVGAVDQRILVLEVIRFQARPTIVVFAVFDFGIEANPDTSTCAVIKAQRSFYVVANGKRDLR